MINTRCSDTSPGSTLWADSSDTDQKTVSLSQATDKKDRQHENRMESVMHMMQILLFLTIL